MNETAMDPRLALGGNNPPEPTLDDKLKEAGTPLLKGITDLEGDAGRTPAKIKTPEDLDAVGKVVIDLRKMDKRITAAKEIVKRPIIDDGKKVENYFKALTTKVDDWIKKLEDRATDYQREVAAQAALAAQLEAKKLRDKAEEERQKANEAAEDGRDAVAGRAEIKANLADQRADELEEKAGGKAADLVRSRGASGTLATAKQGKDFRITDMDQIPLNKLRPYLDREAIEKAIRAFVKFTKGAEPLGGVEIFDSIKAQFR